MVSGILDHMTTTHTTTNTSRITLGEMQNLANMLPEVSAAFRATGEDATAKWDRIFDAVLADLIRAEEAEEAARIQREQDRQAAILATVTDEQRAKVAARIAARRAERGF